MQLKLSNFRNNFQDNLEIMMISFESILILLRNIKYVPEWKDKATEFMN